MFSQKHGHLALTCYLQWLNGDRRYVVTFWQHQCTQTEEQNYKNKALDNDDTTCSFTIFFGPQTRLSIKKGNCEIDK